MNLTKTQAIENSIAHWKRMIGWAEKQPGKDLVSWDIMQSDLGEGWCIEDCDLCKLYSDSRGACPDCPLNIKYGVCGYGIAENKWGGVANSMTWAEWIQNAKLFLKQLESLR